MATVNVTVEKLKEDELVELRDPHQAWQTRGVWAGPVHLHEGYEWVKILGRVFLVERDGERRFVDASQRHESFQAAAEHAKMFGGPQRRQPEQLGNLASGRAAVRGKPKRGRP